VGWAGIIVTMLVLLALALAVAVTLVRMWPPPLTPAAQPADSAAAAPPVAAAAPDTSACPEAAGARVLGICLRSDRRIMLICFLAGMLGSLVHALRSLYWYIGNRRLVYSWLPQYYVLPVVGGLLGMLFFFIIKAGFVTATSTATDLSPAGFAAVSAMIGMFTRQALEKLQQVAETLFARPPQGANPAPGPPPPPHTSSSPSPPAPPIPPAPAVPPGAAATSSGAPLRLPQPPVLPPGAGNP
jgi:hypothetical protein